MGGRLRRPIVTTLKWDIPIINTNSKSKRYFCWRRCRLPQRMYNTPRRLRLAASISSLI